MLHRAAAGPGDVPARRPHRFAWFAPGRHGEKTAECWSRSHGPVTRSCRGRCRAQPVPGAGRKRRMYHQAGSGGRHSDGADRANMRHITATPDRPADRGRLAGGDRGLGRQDNDSGICYRRLPRPARPHRAARPSTPATWVAWKWKPIAPQCSERLAARRQGSSCSSCAARWRMVDRWLSRWAGNVERYAALRCEADLPGRPRPCGFAPLSSKSRDHLPRKLVKRFPKQCDPLGGPASGARETRTGPKRSR